MIVIILIAIGVNSDFKDNTTNAPLHYTAEHGFLLLARAFTSTNKANINITNWLGKTPLALAAANGNNEIVKYLHSIGASMSTVDNFGRTPLDSASFGRTSSHFETVKYLKSVTTQTGLTSIP